MAYQDTSLILPEPVKNNLFLAASEDRRPPFWKREEVGAEAAGRIRSRPRAVPGRSGRLPLPGRPPAFEVAKALVTDPKVLLLDEPTTALGPDEVEALHRTVAACRVRGVGVVYVSHRLPEVLEIADRITVLRDGRNQGTFDAKATTEAELVELIVGRPFEAAFPPPAPEAENVRRCSWSTASRAIVRAGQLHPGGRRDRGHRRRRRQRAAPALRLSGRQPPKAGRVVCDGKELSLISTHGGRSRVVLLPGDRKHEALMLASGERDDPIVAPSPCSAS